MYVLIFRGRLLLLLSS